MKLTDRLNFGFSRRTPLILQTESAECGLACLSMVAGFHGSYISLHELRQRFPVSLKGLSLAGLVRAAKVLNLSARPVRLDLPGLEKLKLPCVLHWNFDHFVVLTAVDKNGAVILDPASGQRRVPLTEVSEAFTGFALELWPDPGFRQQEKKEAVSLRSVLGHIKGAYRSAAHVLAIALALEVFSLVSPLFLQWTIDVAIPSFDGDLIVTLAIGFGLLMLFHELLSALRAWLLIYIGTALNIQVRANVFTHLIQLPVEYFAKRSLGDVTSRFGSIDTIQKTLTTSFLEAIIDGVFVALTLAMMFLYSPLLATISLSAMVLYAVGRISWYRPLHVATEEQIVQAAKQQSHFLETIRGARAIKLFQRQDERRSSWLSLLVFQVNSELKTQKMQLAYKLLNGVLFGLENILIVGFGASMVVQQKYTVGVLVAFIAYKGQFGQRVTALIDKYFDVKMLQLQARRLGDIVLSEPESLSGDVGIERHDFLRTDIEVANLGFRYGEHEPNVFKGVTWTIHAGESVAIVGPSGCGKSTLLQVILGILPATEGDVRVGGVSVKRLGVDTLRSLVGTVMQDDVLFAGSIAENISFFDPNADMAWIAECARTASIADDIGAMPMGYNTQIGDMGSVLSGGQKQRILLARALYKRPKILFLDEATSHLDVEKERAVNEAISKLDITRVIVAHRPETIASASRVISLGT